MFQRLIFGLLLLPWTVAAGQASFELHTYERTDTNASAIHVYMDRSPGHGFALGVAMFEGGRRDGAEVHAVDTLGNPNSQVAFEHPEEVIFDVVRSVDKTYSLISVDNPFIIPREMVQLDTNGSLGWHTTAVDGNMWNAAELSTGAVAAVRGRPGATSFAADTEIKWFDPATGMATDSLRFALPGGFVWGGYGQHVERRPDDGLMLFAGTTNVPGIVSDSNIVAVYRIDPVTHDTLWSWKSASMSLFKGLATADGGAFILGFFSDATGFLDDRIKAVKIDSTGNLEFQSSFDLSAGGNRVWPMSATELDDGGFMVLYEAWNILGGFVDSSSFFMRLDPLGDSLWTRQWNHIHGTATDLMAYGDRLAVVGVKRDSLVGSGYENNAFLAFTDTSAFNPDCSADCVWPGDADYSGEVDIFDLLPIGVAFGETGPVRPMASIAWLPQSAPDWTLSTAGGINLKQVDTDGNGVINDDDTLAVDLNFGLMHPFRPALRADGSLPLFLAFENDSALAGDTVVLGVYLGLDTLLATDVLGLALEIGHDPGLIDTILGMSFSTSWLTPPGGSLLTMARRGPIGRADLGQSRTNGIAVSGHGQVASIKYVLDDDLGGRGTWATGLDWISTAFEILDARIVKADGTPIDFNPIPTVLNIGFQATGLPTLSGAHQALAIQPNPVQQSTTVDIPGAGQLALYDATGRMLGSWTVFAGRRTLDFSSLPSGTYLLQWTGEQAVRSAKVLRP